VTDGIWINPRNESLSPNVAAWILLPAACKLAGMLAFRGSTSAIYIKYAGVAETQMAERQKAEKNCPRSDIWTERHVALNNRNVEAVRETEPEDILFCFIIICYFSVICVPAVFAGVHRAVFTRFCAGASSAAL